MSEADLPTLALEEKDVMLLYAGSFLVYGDRFAIPPLLMTIAHDFRASLAAATLLATVYFFFYGAVQPIFGIVSDRVGRVAVLRVALLGTGLANILAAAAPTLGVLTGAKAITAGFAAAIVPTSLVYVGDQVPLDRRQHVIANVLAAGAAGTVVATIAAGLAGGFASWRFVFLFPGAVMLVVAIGLGRLPESLSHIRGAGPLTQARRVFSRRWASFLIILAFAEGAFMLGMLTFLAPALEATGQSAAVAGAVTAAYGVAVFGSLQVVKRLVRRSSLSSATFIAAGGAILTLAYLTAAADQSVLNILVASILIGIGYALLHSTLQTWATDVAPEARGTAISFFVTAVFTGAAIGTAVAGSLAGDGKFRLLFLVAAALTVPVSIVGSLGRARYTASTEEVSG